jgi:SAM-dependent methyltransferase
MTALPGAGPPLRGGAPAPPPDDFTRMLNAWRESRILLTAVELDLFSAVGGGAGADQVANRLGTDERGTAQLMDALAALGLLVKSDGRYVNAPVTDRFLRAGSPDDRRDATLHTAALWHRWSGLTECVRTGHPAPRTERNSAATEAFIAAMHASASARAPATVAALDLTGVRRVIDLGGGSGGLAIALALVAPEAAIEVLDTPEVVPLTLRYVSEAGLAGRVTARPGNLDEDDFGSGYDLALLSAICHMNGPEANADLVRRAAAALAPGGQLVIADWILSPDRTAPAAGALFTVNMLVNTERGGNYTEAEYFGWLRAAGLGALERRALPGGMYDLVIGTKP